MIGKNKKILIGVLTAALLTGLLFGGNYALDMRYYKEAMAGLTIGNVNLSNVKDGTYTGSYDAKIISAAVRVTVEKGKITDIKLLKHKYDRGGPAVAVLDEIINQQALPVDAISGATNSSKVIMKAVENALNSGRENN